MADRATKRARLAADLAELRDAAAQARTDLRALPAGPSRTAAQRTQARTLRFQLLTARCVLLALGEANDADLDDAT